MREPSISIIVPVYNVEPYLRRCLDSLVGQTLKDIEIICVDDGSTDASSSILQEYAAKDERIRIITQKNGGLSAARNTGMRAAKSENIAFVDSDDYVEPNTYEQALRHMEPGVDYVCFGVQVEGQASDAELRSHERYLQHPREGTVELTDEFLLACDVIACNKIYRRNLICEHENRFPEGVRYEDNFFFHAYSMWSRIAFYLPDKLYHYVRREDSIMGETWSGKNTRATDLIEIARQLYHYCEQHRLLPERRIFFGYLFFMLLTSAFGYEREESRRRDLLQQADSFLSSTGLDFADDKELNYRRTLLQRRILPGTVLKRCRGLFSTKYNAHSARHYFMGIPLFSNHHITA